MCTVGTPARHAKRLRTSDVQRLQVCGKALTQCRFVRSVLVHLCQRHLRLCLGPFNTGQAERVANRASLPGGRSLAQVHS